MCSTPKRMVSAECMTGSGYMTKGPIQEDKVVKVSNMRATIARRLVESKTQLPHFYVDMEVDAGPTHGAARPNQRGSQRRRHQTFGQRLHPQGQCRGTPQGSRCQLLVGRQPGPPPQPGPTFHSPSRSTTGSSLGDFRCPRESRSSTSVRKVKTLAKAAKAMNTANPTNSRVAPSVSATWA